MVPTLFPAVQIEGKAYWDGVFSDNPPVNELVQPDMVGAGNMPEEIWVVKINPTRCATIPQDPEEIVDRRNQLAGNISLFHQLDTIAWLNNLYLKGAIDIHVHAGISAKNPPTERTGPTRDDTLARQSARSGAQGQTPDETAAWYREEDGRCLTDNRDIWPRRYPGSRHTSPSKW